MAKQNLPNLTAVHTVGPAPAPDEQIATLSAADMQMFRNGSAPWTLGDWVMFGALVALVVGTIAGLVL